MNVYVLDACALIAYLNQEPGWEHVENILLEGNCERLVSIVNVYEVCYDAARQAGFDEGMKLFRDLHTFPMEIVDRIDKQSIHHAFGLYHMT